MDEKPTLWSRMRSRYEDVRCWLIYRVLATIGFAVGLVVMGQFLPAT